MGLDLLCAWIVGGGGALYRTVQYCTVEGLGEMEGREYGGCDALGSVCLAAWHRMGDGGMD